MDAALAVLTCQLSVIFLLSDVGKFESERELIFVQELLTAQGRKSSEPTLLVFVFLNNVIFRKFDRRSR